MIATAPLFDVASRPYCLAEGEVIFGRVVRLPTPGTPHGNSLLLDVGKDVIRLPATAAKGHTVLEKELKQITVGAQITVGYRGKRKTADGLREYRDYEVTP